MQGLGLAQLMPGAPTVNLSSYLGFRLRGLPGAAMATVFFLIPCFLLMLLLSYLYLGYGDMPVISGLFRGLGALVVGLVFNTILNLLRSGVKTVFNCLMAIVGFAMVFWFHMGVMRILLITGSASVMMGPTSPTDFRLCLVGWAVGVPVEEGHGDWPSPQACVHFERVGRSGYQQFQPESSPLGKGPELVEGTEP